MTQKRKKKKEHAFLQMVASNHRRKKANFKTKIDTDRLKANQPSQQPKRLKNKICYAERSSIHASCYQDEQADSPN